MRKFFLLFVVLCQVFLILFLYEVKAQNFNAILPDTIEFPFLKCFYLIDEIEIKDPTLIFITEFVDGSEKAAFIVATDSSVKAIFKNNITFDEANQKYGLLYMDCSKLRCRFQFSYPKEYKKINCEVKPYESEPYLISPTGNLQAYKFKPSIKKFYLVLIDVYRYNWQFSPPRELSMNRNGFVLAVYPILE